MRVLGGDSDPPDHVEEEYLPRPKRERQGIALCLSGGGFRASLFHLGALRRLNDLGVLSKLNSLSSVSGGSIIAAHIAARVRPWPEPGLTYLNWERDVAAPFRSFCSKNLRTPAILQRLFPWNWFDSAAGVKALASAYERKLASNGSKPLVLADLPDSLRFVFCATDMVFGVDWIFTKEHVGDYQVGYVRSPRAWTVGRAVAASSCFPPIFNPLPVDVPADQFSGGNAGRNPNFSEYVAGLRLTDGGVYDNMGLEPVWKTSKYILVSDGGATFDPEPDMSLIWRLSRYTEIIGNQVGALRRRWLISSFVTDVLDGTYWGVGSNTGSYDKGAVGYSKELVDEIISEVRTDLDAFSEAEAGVLENHGYMLADVAIHHHVPELIEPSARPFTIPHPEFMDETLVRVKLSDSHKRKFPFGRW